MPSSSLTTSDTAFARKLSIVPIELASRARQRDRAGRGETGQGSSGTRCGFFGAPCQALS